MRLKFTFIHLIAIATVVGTVNAYPKATDRAQRWQFTFESGEGDDDDCPYDDDIQKWKDGMENKEIKKRKFIKIRIEREPIERVLEIDDSLSISDLQKQKKFENFVTYNLYPSDRWSDDYMKVEEVEDIEEEEFPRFVYKDNEGDFCEGVFFEEDGIQSSIYYTSSPSSENSTEILDSNINTWGFIQVFLSCPLEKTKELWNKGEIEELKSYFIPESHCKEVEVINKIYDSRNGQVNISIRNREHLEKRYKCGEISDVLVDNKQ